MDQRSLLVANGLLGLTRTAGMFALLAVLAVAGMAAAMAWALRAARRERSLRDQADRLALLATHIQDLTGAASRAMTSREVVESCLPEILAAAHAAAGAVLLAGPDQQFCALVHSVEYEPSLLAAWQHVPLSADDRLGNAILRHEIIVVDSPGALGARPADVATAGDYRTTVVVPLVIRRQPLGAIVMSFHEPQPLHADVRQCLKTAARRISEALARAERYDSAERARAEAEALRLRADEELRERQKIERALRDSETKYRALAARTHLLYELSAAVSEAVTLDAVAKAVISYGKTLFGASAGSIALLIDRGTQFETLYTEEHGRQPVETWHRFPAEAGLCSTAAVEERQPIFVGSFAEWQERYPRSASLAADSGVVSAATLPLLVEEAAIGVLSFHFMAPVHFDDEYRALLVSVAQHCAQAIDRARLYEAAQRARADAEAANQSKDDFLSTVSHELRTPLTAVLGWATMLRNGTLEPGRTARAIEGICNNAARQAHLIDELLDVSRIAAGRAPLDLQLLDLRDSIRGAVETVMPLAEAKGIDVRLGVHPSVPVTADAGRLEQVFLNLLTNAVKFTPPGGWISVDARLTGRFVEVRVADNGSGIDPAFLPHVFERFRQAEDSTVRRVSGLGLGLFIARHLVEAQGGGIRAESAGPGSGATFVVRLAVAAADDARRPAMLPHDPIEAAPLAPLNDASALNGVRVLLVDDEADVRDVMRAALESSGATVFAAPSAREAVGLLSRVEVDVLLADIAMPERDGYDLIRDVRALPSARIATIPAAAVTACARDDERQRAIDAGFQVHLAKPFDPPELVRTVAGLARAKLDVQIGA
jgi:signal transduction histidine kinase/CheY-like chemotaxis protein